MCHARIIVGLLAGAVFIPAGCNNGALPGNGGTGSPSGGRAKLELPQIAGRYVIAAGQEKQSKAILQGETFNPPARPMLMIDTSDITWDHNASSGGSLLVTAGFGVTSNFDRACADAIDSYGPYTVAVNASGQITGISPSGGFELTATSMELITAESYTVCITFSSTIAGTVVIEALTVR